MPKVHFKYLLLLLTLLAQRANAQVFINELMATNVRAVVDNQGKNPDWVELYNPGNASINLSGYYVSDNPLNPLKYQLKSSGNSLTIPSKGFLVIWCSGDPNRGENHVSFSLSSESESFIITSPDGKKNIDRIDFENQRIDVSYGRQIDGNPIFKYFKTPTPAFTNNGAQAYIGITKPPVFSLPGGFYNQNQKIKISITELGSKLYYSTDGSTPGSAFVTPQKYFYKNQYIEKLGQPDGPILSDSFMSFEYKGDIEINDPSQNPNDLSMKSSTWHFSPFYLPNYKIPKAVTIKAIAEKEGYLPSDVVSQTYFINNNGVISDDFLLISLQTNENSLYDYESGLYNAGKNFDNYRISNNFFNTDFCTPGNYSRSDADAEAFGSFEVFNKTEKLFSQNISFKIHGACSRSVPAKSLRIYGRNNFASFPFFKENPNLLHNNVILRNAGDDYNGTMMRDALVHKLVSQFNIGKQLSRPSVLYLNGEYWGIHNIRERLDNDYLANAFGVNKSNVDMYKVVWYGDNEIEYGDADHINKTLEFIEKNSFESVDKYQEAIKLLDPLNLIDYQITQIFVGNVDWPQNNVRMWRNKTAEYAPYAPYGHDGRWRFLLFDTDKSLGMIVNAAHNSIIDALNKPENIFFKKLIDNQEFKNQFILRFSDALNANLRPGYSTKLFEELQKSYEPEIDKHISRWKTISSKTAWNNECNVVKTYLEQRPQNIINFLQWQFNLGQRFEIKLTNKNRDQGLIKINSLLLSEATQGIEFENNQHWKGKYHENILITIEALPAPGFNFVHWIHKNQKITEKRLIINLNENKEYEAVFEQNNKPDQNTIPASSLADCGYSIDSWSPFSAKGIHPQNAKFVFMNKQEPTKTASIAGFTEGLFNLESKTRINGLDSLGISFVNTSSETPNEGYPDGQLGGLLVAVNTIGLDSAKISWRGRTIVNGTRKYSIALQIRDGDTGDFKDLGTEYKGENGSNRTKTIDNVVIPNEYLNKPYIQVLWRYYYNGTGNSGSRDQLAVDDIRFDVKINSETLNQTGNLNQSNLNSYNFNSTGLRISEENSIYIVSNPNSLIKPQSPAIFAEKREICGTEKIKITSVGCVNGTIFWSNGSKSRSIEVTEGIYSALCQSSCGESEYSQKIEIKRVPKIPPPELLADEDFICPQGNNTLRVNKCEGMVIWSNGTTGPILPLKSGQTGSFSAYCFANGCSSDKTPNLVIATGKPKPPKISTLKTNYCLGESAQLLAQGCVGKIEWENNLSTQQLLKYTADNPGLKSFRARCISLSGECISDWSEPININFVPIPSPPKTIVEISNICEQSIVNLEDAVIGQEKDLSIHFFRKNDHSSPRFLNYKSAETGRYFAFYRNNFGCYSQGSVIDVSIKNCGLADIVTDLPDLAIEITAPKEFIPTNSEFETQIKISNIGKALATETQYGIILPNNVAFVEGENIIYEKGKILGFRSTLKPDETFTKNIKFKKLNESESVLNAQIFDLKQQDLNETNNNKTIYINSEDEVQKLGINMIADKAVPLGDGIFEISADIFIHNLSYKTIKPIQLTFEPWKLTNKDLNVIGKPEIWIDKDLILNPFYTGNNSNTQILVDSMSFIPPKESRKIRILFKVKRNTPSQFPLKLLVYSTYGNKQIEVSTEGVEYDPDRDGDPSNNSQPSEVIFSNPSSALACSQTIVDSIKLNENEHAVTFLVQVQNNGTSPLSNLKIINNLQKTYEKAISFNLQGLPAVKKSWKANAYFDGIHDLNMLDSTINHIINPGETDSLFYSVRIDHSNFSPPYFSQIKASGLSTLNKSLTDLSNSGFLIKPEYSDPTVVFFPKDLNNNIIVKEGFSPNGDGLNETLEIFVPFGKTIKELRIYNRHGSVVASFNQKNVINNKIFWNPNIDIPVGTYFYTCELDQKPFLMSGFITLMK